MFVNTIQRPRILRKNIDQPSKRNPPPFSRFYSNPELGHVLVHSVDQTHAVNPNRSLRFERYAIQIYVNLMYAV